MKKKLLAALMAAAMLLTGCSGGNSSSDSSASGSSAAESGTDSTAANNDIKVGFVYIGSINDGGYTQAHDKGRLAIEEQLGVKTAYIENVEENVSAVTTAIDTLIEENGCNLIYTNSFGFMDGTLQMAKDYPDVKFAHCSGYQRADNMSTYFGKAYQARYLTGIVAGMKTEKNYIGYVAAKPIPEVIRGINAFTLGVQSVNPDAKVEVYFTNTWYDPTEEKNGALALLNKGVDVIAQHQDTTAPQVAAQEKGAYCIGYNFPTPDAAPEAYLTAACFDWATFYVDDCKRAIDGTWTSRAYWEGLSEHMTYVDTLTSLCAEGTQEKVDAAQAAIIDGTLEPFTGPLYDQDGNLKVEEGVKMTDDEIWNMDWYVQGVITSTQN
ncbi:MAG: BMP family ABC transporter substrate-binding protein [Oscillospiraceae bacterium]|nr:BMP family ABC transporter substrate-binding protein [Oscillospiraceae bacterium]